MKFGVREICDVVFKAKAKVKIGTTTFEAGEPVLYIDSAKTSTIEGTATTVYATGGRGNTRLIAWEGEKTLTFTVEDALLSPVGFAILSGAGLLGGDGETGNVHVHTTAQAFAGTDHVIDLTNALDGEEEICTDNNAVIYVIPTAADGSLNGKPVKVTADGVSVSGEGAARKVTITANGVEGPCFVDFYVKKAASKVHELQIDAANFAGYYYVEASTLFRRRDTGIDMPAEITFPNVKIQSNFTFTLASTGDPSTFSFTMDAFPGYTYFNPNRKVLCAIQIVEDAIRAGGALETVFPCKDAE